MNSIYKDILIAKKQQKRLLAVLLDPDKLLAKDVAKIVYKINESHATHIFVGGSTVANGETETLVVEIKKHTSLPVVLFPGNFNQVTYKADAILFLSLLSGRNPEYLIEQQIKAAPYLREINLEIIPTGYVLVNGGVETAVQKVSRTVPIEQENTELITNTALAGEYLGKKLIYLEAGSGAIQTVRIKNISSVAKALSIPLIVGGGIRSQQQMQLAYDAGADLVVIGTAFENDSTFFEK
ncbi:geranylgeranylglyceryl/heptaprenylglyceryl phosphate synthase [Pseudofulvibacter geojedonensis]|uniref:Geranylgeranylglyceryl phosphate synthase n=1 Tax=Pseudofulvibacter geojedonensis TaxID=1123758 RepID=A0ABW3I1L5_9FLAO